MTFSPRFSVKSSFTVPLTSLWGIDVSNNFSSNDTIISSFLTVIPSSLLWNVSIELTYVGDHCVSGLRSAESNFANLNMGGLRRGTSGCPLKSYHYYFCWPMLPQYPRNDFVLMSWLMLHFFCQVWYFSGGRPFFTSYTINVFPQAHQEWKWKWNAPKWKMLWIFLIAWNHIGTYARLSFEMIATSHNRDLSQSSHWQNSLPMQNNWYSQ